MKPPMFESIELSVYVLPMTTFRLEAMTSVTVSPTYAQPYCVARVPRVMKTPPAIANKIDGQLSYIVQCIVRTFALQQKL